MSISMRNGIVLDNETHSEWRSINKFIIIIENLFRSIKTLKWISNSASNISLGYVGCIYYLDIIKTPNKLLQSNEIPRSNWRSGNIEIHDRKKSRYAGLSARSARRVWRSVEDRRSRWTRTHNRGVHAEIRIDAESHSALICQERVERDGQNIIDTRVCFPRRARSHFYNTFRYQIDFKKFVNLQGFKFFLEFYCENYIENFNSLVFDTTNSKSIVSL